MSLDQHRQNGSEKAVLTGIALAIGTRQNKCNWGNFMHSEI